MSNPSGLVYSAFLEVQEAEIKKRKHDDHARGEPEPYYRVPEFRDITFTVTAAGTMRALNYALLKVYRPDLMPRKWRRTQRNLWILKKQASL